jgi:hypothetical protein
MFNLGEKYKIIQKESQNIIYIKRRYYNKKDNYFIIATINTLENKIKVNVGDDYYVISDDINEDFIKMIIQFYEDWIKAKEDLENSLSKFKSLSKGDKYFLREWKLNDLGI